MTLKQKIATEQEYVIEQGITINMMVFGNDASAHHHAMVLAHKTEAIRICSICENKGELLKDIGSKNPDIIVLNDKGLKCLLGLFDKKMLLAEKEYQSKKLILERTISNRFDKLDFNPKNQSYGYALAGLKLQILHSDENLPIVKGIYMPIAEKYKTKPGTVESLLRDEINKAYEKYDKTDLTAWGVTGRAPKKMTCGGFFKSVARSIMLEIAADELSE